MTFYDSLEAFLKLAAVFRSSHDGGHVERDDTLVKQGTGHLALDDAFGQSLDDGALAHTGLANHHRVVLLAAAQDLGETFNLYFTAHNGVQAAFGCLASDILAIFIDNGSGRIVTPTDISSLSCLAVGRILALALTAIVAATRQIVVFLILFVREVGTRYRQRNILSPVVFLEFVLVVYHVI